jgi:hypothetical protein
LIPGRAVIIATQRMIRVETHVSIGRDHVIVLLQSSDTPRTRGAATSRPTPHCFNPLLPQLHYWDPLKKFRGNYLYPIRACQSAGSSGEVQHSTNLCSNLHSLLSCFCAIAIYHYGNPRKVTSTGRSQERQGVTLTHPTFVMMSTVPRDSTGQDSMFMGAYTLHGRYERS